MSLQHVKMTKAIDTNGVVVDIKNSKNGKSCNCRCIVCHAPLIARQGEKYSKHFAHDFSAGKVDCSWSGETELHLKVKEYFSKLSTFKVPIGIHDPIMEMIKIDDVKLEMRHELTRRIPDVTILSGGEIIIVEIGVTHFCGKTKIDEYKSNNMNVIELDFSKFEPPNDTISDNDIKNYFINNNLIFKWLSVSPAGYLGEKIHAHERKALQKLNYDYNTTQNKYSQGIKRLKSLDKEVIKEKQKLLLNCEETLEHTFNVNLSEEQNIALLKKHYSDLKATLKVDLAKHINYAKRDTELDVKMSFRYLLKNLSTNHIKANQKEIFELETLLSDLLVKSNTNIIY